MRKFLIFSLIALCSCSAQRKSDSVKAITDTTAINTERRVVTAKEAEIKRTESEELDEGSIILGDGTLQVDPDGTITLSGIKGIKASRKAIRGETEAKAAEEAEETVRAQERRGVSQSERKRTEAKGEGIGARQLIAMFALCFLGGAVAWRLLRDNDNGA